MTLNCLDCAIAAIERGNDLIVPFRQHGDRPAMRSSPTYRAQEDEPRRLLVVEQSFSSRCASSTSTIPIDRLEYLGPATRQYRAQETAAAAFGGWLELAGMMGLDSSCREAPRQGSNKSLSERSVDAPVTWAGNNHHANRSI